MDEVIIIATLGDDASDQITIQDFEGPEGPFIPIFSDLDAFRVAVKGTPLETRGVAVKRDFLRSILKGDETLVLDPGSPDPLRLTVPDLNSSQLDQRLARSI